MSKTHEYTACLTWNGNQGTGTASYTGYGREYKVTVQGKPDLKGSADPMFHGAADLHNPEDLFIASISACHMLTYLALCAKHKISVAAYQDDARGMLELTSDGGGKFQDVTLNPLVTISAGDEEKALSLHDDAHRLCYIAQSCSAPIKHNAIVKVVPAQSTE